MLNRRDFLRRSLATSSLVAMSGMVPGFVANTAQAAEKGKDTILVIIEMTGGNDGLNMVAPYKDDDYKKARPTLKLDPNQVVKLNDELGMHPAFLQLQQMVQNGNVCVVQGVGYPNPDRSHFESMDRWQSAVVDLKKVKDGWLARGVEFLNKGADGGVPILHLGKEKLPLALRGTNAGIFTVNQEAPLKLDLGEPNSAHEAARKKLLKDIAGPIEGEQSDSLTQFVRKRHLNTYTSLETLKEVLASEIKSSSQTQAYGYQPGSLFSKFDLITKLIRRGFGTRVFYTAIDGFDTHSGQADAHRNLLTEIATAVQFMFGSLNGGDDKRVLVMTYSEFGRRVAENGSRGTDHGAASNMLLIGPGVNGNIAIGKHPSLTNLDDGDLRMHTDFRQVYASILDGWLGCDSTAVLGEKFEPVPIKFKKV